jgi:adenylyl-sulfate kinase
VTGFVVWFTGLSGSGKSTLATLLANKLAAEQVHTEILDGDEVRRNLSKGLGFSREDRAENLRRLGFVATVVARTGSCAIAAAISPYRDVRDEIRGLCSKFCEVYVECPLEVLTERDPKGLYKKALRGEIKNMTGVNDPYEAPTAPDVVVRTDRETPEQSVELVLARLRELGFLAAQQSH